MLTQKRIASRSAFTLVESLVVMGIVGSLLILSMTTRQAFSHHSPRAEQAFWHALNSNWQEAQYAAKYRNQRTSIAFHQHEVVFKSGLKEGQPTKLHQLDYPSTLVGPEHEVDIYADSHADPQRLQFRSKLKNGNRTLTVQMGWGLYRLEKK